MRLLLTLALMMPPTVLADSRTPVLVELFTSEGCSSCPQADDALAALATRIRSAGEPVYVYFRHEDEPTAPAYATRLVELLSAS